MNSCEEPVQHNTGTPLIIQKDQDTWVFNLNRPTKRNALSPDLVAVITDGLQEARAASVPQIIFRGNGKNFCAGFDLTDSSDISDGDLLLRLIQIELLLQQIATYPGITLVLAHGTNVGAGVDIMAACNQRYSTQDAIFRMPGLKFGLLLGTRRFRKIVGPSAALSILGSARQFNANEALDVNFLHRIEDIDNWEQLISQSRSQAVALDPNTRNDLHRILFTTELNDDLAELVRSASVPGLKARIQAYRS